MSLRLTEAGVLAPRLASKVRVGSAFDAGPLLLLLFPSGWSRKYLLFTGLTDVRGDVNPVTVYSVSGVYSQF